MNEPRDDSLYRHRLVVREAEIDELGHASNLCYLGWLLDAATAHSAALGWPAARYLELGAAWVVRRHELEYRRATLAGDALVVETWVSQVRAASCVREYRILRGQALIMKAATGWAFIDLKRGSPTRVPPVLAEALAHIRRDAPPPLPTAPR